MLRPVQNQTRNLLDLSGLWNFQLDPNAIGETNQWFHTLPEPRNIAVPGSWNEQFTDTDDYLGHAWYSLRTHVPQSWRGQDILLHVGSANYAARVWINDEFAGSHEGGHLPFAFSITDHVAWDGENVIAIEVENELLPDRVPPGNSQSAGPAAIMNNVPPTSYDFFPYAGLHRQVWLAAVPKTHLADVTVVTDIDGTDGVVTVIARVEGEDWSGRGTVEIATDDGSLAADLSFSDGAAETTIRVPHARFWAPGNPALYSLTVTLHDGDDGAVLDCYSLDIGIRTVKVEGDRVLLNGEPIFLKGFGKHEDSPAFGRALNMPQTVQDNSLMRWIGANSYRTSHYPYAEEALDLADREGILLISEIPAVGLSFDDGEENISRRLGQCLQQIEELVARDKNHPSVILWSVANEPVPNNMGGLDATLLDDDDTGDDASGGNAFFTTLTNHARGLDPTRPVVIVLVQGGSPRSWMDLSDVVCINRYFGWYVNSANLTDARQALAGELDAIHEATGKPIIITEFGADTIAGRHNEPPVMFSEEYQVGLLHTYLDVAAERPFVAGLHVWNFADFRTSQSVLRPGGYNLKGVFTRDRKPKMAAHFLRGRWNG